MAACEDKKGSKWCSKKLSKCSKDKISSKCELSCGVCGGAAAPPPPPPACEYVDKKGTEWCAKKAKNAKKLSKLCASGKAKKCEQTCAGCNTPSPPPPPPAAACEDKKGADWCAKKTKSASKAKKTCGDPKKAKKCELTCCECDLWGCCEIWS